ncbi:MAG TPA: biopolymer transporter ExbD [Ohtaekwangia sp.]|nr:biopolymer transporter ExbD [Ohtaekwangia sp.]
MPRATPDIPNASMADIAFLLLTFFLMTTTVANDKGILLTLPPPPENIPQDVEIHERNLFKIQVNSFNNVMVEGEPWTGSDRELIDRIKRFVLNYGNDASMSDSPKDAVVSIKTDRGTSHEKFIQVLDASEAAYNEIYADRAGVSVERWRDIAADPNADPATKELYDRGRGITPAGEVEIPKAISIAEPTKIGG